MEKGTGPACSWGWGVVGKGRRVVVIKPIQSCPTPVPVLNAPTRTEEGGREGGWEGGIETVPSPPPNQPCPAVAGCLQGSSKAKARRGRQMCAQACCKGGRKGNGKEAQGVAGKGRQVRQQARQELPGTASNKNKGTGRKAM